MRRTCRYGAASAINAAAVHVLVDLSGWTIFPGVEVFAMRPAPLQLQLHGYPGSMGAEYYQVGGWEMSLTSDS
jgi:predicted O-linked N-acetylglucosamine transferase (SPINDLY family)